MMGLTRWWSRMPVAGRVIVSLVLAAVVFAIVALGVDFTAALMVLAIIAVAAGLFLLIRWLVVRREKRKGQGLAGKLWAGMSGGAGSGLDESTEDLSIRQEMEGRWKKVYETLRERRYDYYSFPWYLIIGAAQSGKTTTIQKSNQEFPIGDEPVVDYGGTKGCNWFFTNQAIIIDTAGRYVEHLGEDDAEWDSMLARDQEEWSTFLKLLREGRARSPVNGVIITIKLEDVLEQDARKRKKTTDAMRKALLDIEEKLAVRVPVYVLVTMCDLLVGFVDYFANLPGLSDRTLFGWSRTAPFDKEFDADEFAPAFAELSAKVDGMMLDFLEAQAGRGGDLPADVTRMDRMLAFPDEFRSLGEPLQQLLDEIFKKSAYNEQHFVRGVYFTSGVQEGRPVMNACLNLVGDGASGLQEDDVSLSTDGSKAYFIADLYEEKVFKEAGLVRMTRRARSAQRLKRLGYSGVAAALAIAAGLWVAVEITAINALELFSPDALTALAAADVTPAGLHDDPELLSGGDGLAGLAAAVAEMGSERYREASLLGREDVDDARRSLHDAFRKLFAEKALDPLLRGAFAEWGEREPERWSECARLTEVLLAVRELGTGGGSLDVLREDVLGGLDALAAPDGKPDFEQLVALADALPADGGDGGLAHVRRVAAAHTARVDELLAGPVLSWWNGWLGGLTDPLAHAAGPVALRPDLDDLVPFWSWQGMMSLDGQLADELGALTRVLGEVKGSARLAEFRSTVSRPWSEHFGDVSRLRGDLDAHLESMGRSLDVGAGKAREQLAARLEPLTGLDLDKRSPGSAEARLAEAVEALRRRVADLGERLEDWAAGQPKVVELRRQGSGLAATGADVLGTERGLTWNPTSQLTRSLWSRLLAIHELVGYVPADDPASDPSSQVFGDLATRFTVDWFEKDGAEATVADTTGYPLAVRELMIKAGDAQLLTTLRNQRFDAFAAHLAEQLADASRAEFVGRIGAGALRTRGFNETGLPARLEAEPANADVVAGFLGVTHSLRREVGRRREELSAGADSLRGALDLTAQLYAEQVVGPYWNGDGLLVLAREIDLVPAPPARGWSELLDWHRGLSGGARGLSGFRTLAVYAGDQSADAVADALGALALAEVTARLDAPRKVWERYADSANVERVADVAQQLSRALGALAALEGGQPDDWSRLRAVQQGGVIYAGLMAPQRLREGWSAGGFRDPLVEGLYELSMAARATLGDMASQVFRELWLPLADGVALPLFDKFPFRRLNLSLETDEAVLASWDDTKAFFEHEDVRKLVEVIYPHVDPPGPASAALYTVDFGAPAIGENFRRCVQLRQLCRIDEAAAPGVRLELFDGFAETGDSPNHWELGLGQSGSEDDTELVLPLESQGLTGRFAPVWRPGERSQVTWQEPRDRRDSDPGAKNWGFDGGPLSKRSHWANVLMFVYQTDRGEPASDAKAPAGVRWIKVKLRKQNREGARVVGVRMEGMPAELPDLHEAFDKG